MPDNQPTAEARPAAGSPPPDRVPDQVQVPWTLAFALSWASLRRRFLRSLVTMAGVILAVAFLAYMLITDQVAAALVRLNDDAVNLLLQRAGVDIYTAGKTDRMMLLLIGLSLLTCAVGIVNSMLMAVTERIREIGTLKCLGALDSFIVRAYFIESTIQGVLGTLLGMALGLGVAFGVSLNAFGRAVLTAFPGGAVARALGVAFLLGACLSVAASILPAWWAARKEPVEAMRVEQ